MRSITEIRRWRILIEVTSFLARVKVNLFGGCVGTQQEDMETALQEEDMRH